MKTADFSAHLTEFLSHYLPELKNISTNTISSYCDAFRLFLGYCQDVEGMRIEKLSIDDLTPELVDHFLQWLRIERNNGTATRSQRLAAIRSFVKYLQIKEPRLLLNFQQILAIPVKRAERKAINPLTKEAIALILRQPDTSTLSGRRDATILCFLYDTAARVQEICDLRIEDVRLDYPASVKILGKGRKTRVVPILPATAQNLKKYLTEMHMLAPEKSHLPLFMNRNGQKLTRAGVTYILNKYAKAASVIDPSIPEKIPPHLMRHTMFSSLNRRRAAHGHPLPSSPVRHFAVVRHLLFLIPHFSLNGIGYYPGPYLRSGRCFGRCLVRFSLLPRTQIPQAFRLTDMIHILFQRGVPLRLGLARFFLPASRSCLVGSFGLL